MAVLVAVVVALTATVPVDPEVTVASRESGVEELTGKDVTPQLHESYE